MHNAYQTSSVWQRFLNCICCKKPKEPASHLSTITLDSPRTNKQALLSPQNKTTKLVQAAPSNQSRFSHSEANESQPVVTAKLSPALEKAYKVLKLSPGNDDHEAIDMAWCNYAKIFPAETSPKMHKLGENAYIKIYEYLTSLKPSVTTNENKTTRSFSEPPATTHNDSNKLTAALSVAYEILGITKAEEADELRKNKLRFVQPISKDSNLIELCYLLIAHSQNHNNLRDGKLNYIINSIAKNCKAKYEQYLGRIEYAESHPFSP